MTTCPSCACDLELDAVFCGQCGARVRARRKTLVGAELDGRFHVTAKIAEGGFGSVYVATHLASKHVVALKVLHCELAADESLAARFRREGETLSSLRSPHTVSVYEVGETDDGTLYIAMELLRGESLLDRFRARGPLPWRSVLEITKQVCRSLGEAHALGIIHRDLKPANIHLERNDHVKVIDFGIAKLMRGSDIDDGEDLTRVGQAVGTLEYMAPEQLIGAHTDGRSDIYALGVLIYEMLVGRRPYEEATGPTSLVAAVMTQPLIAPSAMNKTGGIPPEVDRLVLRCLSKESRDRYAKVGDLIEAIDTILVPLARGSWSTELADEESTWIDAVPLPSVIITPSQPAMHAQPGIGYANTRMQVAMSPTTAPGIAPVTPSRIPITPSRAPTDVQSPLTPSRGMARGSSSPVMQRGSSPSQFTRPRRESDLELKSEPKLEVPKRITPGGYMTPTREPTPPPEFSIAVGSRVNRSPYPDPFPETGSVPLVNFDAVDAAAPTVPVPTVVRLETVKPPVTDKTRAAQPVTALRVLVWAIVLLAGGAGLGMVIGSFLS